MDTLIWITGASAGFGAALAATAPQPSRVIDVSRSGGTPGTTHLAADLADPASWPAVAASFHDELAEFDGDRVVLVQNAGTITPVGFAGEVDDGAYRTNVLLNAAAPQVLGHAFLRALRESGFAGRSELVMVSSGAARNPYAGWSAYSAGKAALDAWVRAVGDEQQARGSGCRVLSLSPGVLATAMQERVRETPERDFPQVAKFLELHTEGRLRAPSDAARDTWRLLDTDVESGAVVDLRTVASS